METIHVAWSRIKWKRLATEVLEQDIFHQNHNQIVLLLQIYSPGTFNLLRTLMSYVMATPD